MEQATLACSRRWDRGQHGNSQCPLGVCGICACASSCACCSRLRFLLRPSSHLIAHLSTPTPTSRQPKKGVVRIVGQDEISLTGWNSGEAHVCTSRTNRVLRTTQHSIPINLVSQKFLPPPFPTYDPAHCRCYYLNVTPNYDCHQFYSVTQEWVQDRVQCHATVPHQFTVPILVLAILSLSSVTSISVPPCFQDCGANYSAPKLSSPIQVTAVITTSLVSSFCPLPPHPQAPSSPTQVTRT